MNYTKIAVIAIVLLLMETTLSSAATISSRDGLTLSISQNGEPTDVTINDTSLPMLAAQGGFSFREVLINSPNLLANPGFESGTNKSLNWSFVTNNGNTPVWDTISHSGARSVKINIPGTNDNKSGYLTSDLIKSEPLQDYTLSAWVKTQDAAGTNAPAVRVVELDANKKQLRQTSLIFSKGTNDWIQKKIDFQTGIDTSWVYVYANIWNGYGTFWVDDIELKQFFGSTIYLNGTLTQNPDGTVTQKATADNIEFTFYYIPKGRYIEFQGEIQDLSGEDRALQVTYKLPVDAEGWRWNDYIGRNRVITGNTYYGNLYMIGDKRTQSTYPFALIDNNTHGLSIAVPMDVPRIYRTRYNLANGYSIQYDFGLSSQTLKIGPGYANFTFVMYKADEPEWAFRDAVKKYYELYPQFFEKRIEREGLWIASSGNLALIPNTSDFGFAFDEFGRNNIFYDNVNGMYSFAYTEPWGWWRSFGNNPNKPSYDERMSALKSDLRSTVEWGNGIQIKDMANAVINSAITDQQGNYYLDADSSFWQAYNGWSQNYPTNPDPDIPSLNRFDISYKETQKAVNVIDYWTFGQNALWDSIITYNSGHSAKISLQTAMISGEWRSEYIHALPNTQYTFSAWIKTENATVGNKPAIYVRQIYNNGTYGRQYVLAAVAPNSDWTLRTVTFTTNPDTIKLYVYANIYNGNGTAWYDNVSLIKTGSTENLLKNGGFEENKYGNKTEYAVDGIYVDSIRTAASWGWPTLENYRKEHWSYTDVPLVFGMKSKQPTLLNIFSIYEYLDEIHNRDKNKYIMLNLFPYGYSFYAHLSDVSGSEIWDIETVAISSYRRTMSYKKPITNLMQWRGSEPISHKKMEDYIKNEMFYGIYPSISGGGNNINYWLDATLYERDRNLFKKYVPIIKEISKAGWEPIPYAIMDNPNIIIERYGYADKNNLYYTVRNDQLNPQTGTLTVDLAKLGVDPEKISKVIVTELTSGAITNIKSSNQLSVSITIDPADTQVYKVDFI